MVQPWGRVLVPPQGIYITVPLSSAGTNAPIQVEVGMMMLTLLTSINKSLYSVDLCPNSMLNSPLLKPSHEYAYTCSLKLPQICCWGDTALGKIRSVLLTCCK